MARLGELLVAAKVLTADQVEQALRAQVMWGGRLGTNLIELGYLDLDALSKALGRQHGQPAALARHFDKADRALQRLLSPDVAERYECIPLARSGAGKGLIAFASVAPLDAKGRAIVADELAVAPDQLLPSIAAELRIRYHLERVYEIPRSTRFLRSKGKTIPPFPQFQIDVEGLAADERAVHDLSLDDDDPTPPPRPPPPPRSDTITEIVDFSSAAVLEDVEDNDSLGVPVAQVEDEPSGRDRRKYVPTFAPPLEQFEPIVEAPVGETPKEAAERHALARIAIKKVVRASGGGGSDPMLAVAPPAMPEVSANTIGEATRAIRRGTDRDKVGDLVVATIERFVPTCQAALLLVVRGELAIGWKGFSRTGAAVPEIGVPLEEPGLIPRVVQRAQSLRSPATDLTAIDQLLLVSLAGQAGDLVVVPVTIGGRVMCLIAMVTPRDEQITSTESIAAAAGAAFARLMRDASR